MSSGQQLHDGAPGQASKSRSGSNVSNSKPPAHVSKSRAGSTISNSKSPASKSRSGSNVSGTKAARPVSGSSNRRPGSSASGSRSRPVSSKGKKTAEKAPEIPIEENKSPSPEPKAPSPEPPPPTENGRQSTDNDKHAQDDTEHEKASTPPQAEDYQEQEANKHEDHLEVQQTSPEIAEEEEEEEAAFDAANFDPANFDPRAFLERVTALSEQLRAPELRAIDPKAQDPASALTSIPREVRHVSRVMAEYRAFSDHAEEQLETLRDQLRELKDRMYKRVHSRPYDPRNVPARQSLEERQLEARSAALSKELARAAEELVRAAQVTMETEAGSTAATLAAEQAEEEARQIQAEYEARRKADMETRRLEEERRREDERRKLEEEARQNEQTRAEEARRARLRGEQEDKAPEWHDWPTFTYNASDSGEEGEERHAVSCVVRGDPGKFRENDIHVATVGVLEARFKCADSEELVGSIVHIQPASEEEGGKFKGPVQLVMPHVLSRAAAMTRDAVIRGKVGAEETWTEFKSHDVTLDGHKDMKFVQAEIEECGTYAVVSKAKTDYMLMNKRGGKVVASVDQRVTFQVDRGTFKTKENFILQLLHVDSSTVNDVRKSEEGRGLLTSSAIVSLEWSSKEFEHPVTMTLPCPPNPATAKKAAAARAAKEAKAKKTQPSYDELEEERKAKQKKEKSKSEQARMAAFQDDSEEADEARKKNKQTTKWYMGQYGNTDDDESEIIYFLKKMKSGRWAVVEDMVIQQPKLDLLQFELKDPVAKFMVLRVSTDVDTKDAAQLAQMIEHHLTEKTVTVILKQRSDSGVECCLQVVPVSRKEKSVQALEEQGYDDGPGASADIILKEGERLELQFRGNVKGAQDRKLDLVFSSQLTTSLYFEIEEVNRFLQKNYPTFRGFVQLFRKIEVPPKPMQKDITKDDSADQDAPQVQYQYEIVCEHLVNVPKEVDVMQSLKCAPVLIPSRDAAITNDGLRFLARELGDEWQRVAQHLNVKRMRIQAIMRNNMAAHGSDEDVKYDMLITWIKRVPMAVNKVDVLINALSMAGRTDLATEVRDRADNYRRRRIVDGPEASPASREGSRAGSRASVEATA